MKLYLFDRDQRMTDAWTKEFSDEEHVTVVNADLDAFLSACKPDAISSAGNSYGIMGAGIDGTLRSRFPGLQEKVKESVAMPPWCGEVPVGVSLPVLIPNPEETFVPHYLLYTPTMKAPGTIYHGQRQAHYAVRIATRAALGAAISRNVPSLALPGFATGIGGVPHAYAARFMREGYNSLRSYLDGAST